MDSALGWIAGGVAVGSAMAAQRRDGWRDVLRLFPALFIGASMAWLWAWLIWPVLPLVWQAGARHEAVGGFVASLLPVLVGGLADPDAPFQRQCHDLAWLGCAFVGACFIGYPFVINLIGAAL